MEDEEKSGFQTHIGFLVHDVSRKRRNYFDRTLRPLGLTRSQLLVLLHLERLPTGEGISQKKLAEEMHIGAVSLGELVALLVEQGAIERKVDARDRRQRNLLLSPVGRDMIARSRTLIARMNAEILQGIDQQRIADAEQVLATIQKNLARLSA